MSVYVATRPEMLSQGDILENVPFLRRRGRDLGEVEIWPMLGIVTAHSCEIDKYDRALERGHSAVALWPVSVAPVMDIEMMPTGQPADARRGKIKRYAHLPSEDGNPEMVVDFYFDQPVPIQILRALKKRAHLSDQWVTRLQSRMVIFRTRRDLDAEVPPS
ncbi:MAG: hypothetical protein AB7V42_16125 [Thermoleophilia bacterium]